MNLIISKVHINLNCVRKCYDCQQWEAVLVGEDPQLGILLRKGFHEPFPQEYSQLRVFTHENILPLLAVIAFANKMCALEII